MKYKFLVVLVVLLAASAVLVLMERGNEVHHLSSTQRSGSKLEMAAGKTLWQIWRQAKMGTTGPLLPQTV